MLVIIKKSDEYPARFFKDGSSVIAKFLTHIVNLSIISGNILNELKVARVISLCNNNDPYVCVIQCGQLHQSSLLTPELGHLPDRISRI